MKLTIDNRDGKGPQDYTGYLSSEGLPSIQRRLNRASEMTASLVSTDPNFGQPASGARVILVRSDGVKLFTGYLAAAPQRRWLGYSQQGPAWEYALRAVDDSWLLDRNALAVRPVLASRTAGDALRTITNDVLPGGLDVSGVQDIGPINQYSTHPQKSWSEHAQELATMMRASYSAQDGKLTFAPVGQQGFDLRQTDTNFIPEALTLQQPDLLRNDVTIVGDLEPRVYVRDYFLGDGLTLAFYLSEIPFETTTVTVLQEDYESSPLTPTLWSVTNGNLVIANGELQVNGPATIKFVEQVELAAGLRMQHGQVVFNAPSAGMIGAIYNGALGEGNCLGGFKISPYGTNSAIQAVVAGVSLGPIITTQPGHVYAFSTQLLANEAHRVRQSYYSSAHGAGNARGGDSIPAAMRLVLTVHDVDPGNPGTIAAPATVLYDNVLASTPGFALYGLIDATDLYCNVSFTRVQQVVGAEVRSMIPGQSFRTRLTGALADGGECYVTSTGSLRFYPPYPPQLSEQIVVAYRSSGRAMARVQDPASISAHVNGSDNGQRSCVKRLKFPPAPTAIDCENAALAVLDDATLAAWAGEYRVPSTFLPASEILPGMAARVNAPSWAANFQAIVHEVDVQVLAADRELAEYRIKFTNDAAEPLGVEFNNATLQEPLQTVFTTTGPSSSMYLAPLTAAQITNAIATEITVDAGTNAPTGGGFEVRRSDGGWGPASDGNLVGRYTTRTFTLPRLSRVQDYYLRQYDASSPRKYGRYSALLHLDYPYE